MKSFISQSQKILLVAALWLPLAIASAQAQAPTVQAGVTVAPGPAVTTDAPVVSPGATVKLPYGVADVLKLCHSKVNDDVIVSYVQNTGTIYNLSAQDIVYLREQGVSDRVISTMLDQRQRVIASAGPQGPAPAPAPQSQVPIEAPLVPSQGPASTVDVIPYNYSYYDPYYYGYSYPYYYGYPYPYFYGGWWWGGHGYYHSHGGIHGVHGGGIHGNSGGFHGGGGVHSGGGGFHGGGGGHGGGGHR